MFRDSVRSFVRNEIGPHAERWNEQGVVDREAFLKAGEMGILCMWVPEEYGGIGMPDFRYEQIVNEEVTRFGDPGVFFTLHSRLVAPYIGTFGTDEQKARWLPKCVTGESILAIAMTEAGAGSDLSAVRTKAEDKGDHFLLNGSKTAAYDATLEYVGERKMFGQTLADFQNTRFKLAEMRTELDVGHAFIDHCVTAHNDGKLTAEDAAKSKLWVSEMENRVTDTCVQLHGGNGFMMEYEVCRRHAAARVSRIYAGTSEIMKEIIARSLGLDPRKKQKAQKRDAA